MKREGYNVFVLGPIGSGKHAVVRRLLRQQAAREAVPTDWCYVYNFDRPHKPRVLKVPAGQGVKLSEAVDKLVEDLRSAIPAVFESDDYRNRRKQIEDDIKKRQEDAFNKVQEEAQANNISILQTEGGIAFAPVRDGKMVPPEEFNALPEPVREGIQEKIRGLQERFREILQRVPKWAREARERVEALNQEVTSVAAKAMIEDRRAQFKDLPQVLEYFDAFEADVAQNVSIFLHPAGAVPPQMQAQALISRYAKKGAEAQEPGQHQVLADVGVQFQLEQAHRSALRRPLRDQQQMVDLLDEGGEGVDVGLAQPALRRVGLERADHLVGKVDAGQPFRRGTAATPVRRRYRLRHPTHYSILDSREAFRCVAPAAVVPVP